MLTLPLRSILMEKFDQHWIIGGLSREGSLRASKAGKKMTDLRVSFAGVSGKEPVSKL